MDSIKTPSNVEIMNGLKSGMFVHIRGYVNEHGEKQNVTIHVDASYERTHVRSMEKLAEIEKDETVNLTITRHAWVDEAGTEYTRKAKGRTLKAFTDIVNAKDPDWAQAIDKVRKGLEDPKAIVDNFEKVATSTYDNANTGRVYLRNVLVHSKTVVPLVIDGQTIAPLYPVTCSAKVNAIANAVRKMLPVGQYRTYIVDDKPVEIQVNGQMVNVPRYEYISLMGSQISSSSSSEE